MHTQQIDVQCNAQHLSFESAAFESIMLVNVLHHLHDPEKFFEESSRCLIEGGTICMIEPWNTPWANFFYSNFHHEKFDPSVSNWSCVEGVPLSGSNQAIPWIIFKRDLLKFTQKFPELKVEVVQPLMPLVYILAGGISLQKIVPAFSYSFWRKVEKMFELKQGMFALIVIRKKPLI